MTALDADIAPPRPADFPKDAEIESRDQLARWMEAGSKPKTDWRIGSEHEKFGFVKDTLEPLPYHGPASIDLVLGALAAAHGWTPKDEDGRVIALVKNGASVSLEPGGQLELSGAPLEHLHQTCAEVNTHLKELRGVAEPMGAGFLGLGFAPTWRLAEMPIMPKERYRIMRAYMPRVGGLGRQMMFRTCTVQVNLDFDSEQDMALKMRVGLALQPIATALFANSPLREGRPNGFLSYRAFIWQDVDPARTGSLPFVFEDGFGFERYVDWALTAPMYFIERGGRLIEGTGGTFADFLAGAHPALPGEKPLWSDWDTHLTTLFPEVRLKRFIEMRGADSGPWSRICALPAFWTGLLYHRPSLEGAWEMVKDWTESEREGLKFLAAKFGMGATFRGRTMSEWAMDALKLSREGLKARAQINAQQEDERLFLDDLFEIAETGVTPACRILERYHGAWAGDARRAFEEFVY